MQSGSQYNTNAKKCPKSTCLLRIFIFSVALRLVVSFNGANVWLTPGWQQCANQSTTWMRGIPKTICCICVGHICLLDASPFCIFYNLIWMTNKWVFVERAEYSVKMLMHHFMEIRHWAKRQQIYKHLFTFDVLPHIAAIATEPAKWRIYLRDMQTYYLTPRPPKHCGFSHSVCISVIRSIECTLQGW